jgi:hypothetical protein
MGIRGRFYSNCPALASSLNLRTALSRLIKLLVFLTVRRHLEQAHRRPHDVIVEAYGQILVSRQYEQPRPGIRAAKNSSDGCAFTDLVKAVID